MADTYFCSRCNKTMDENSFYTYKNGKKTELCKKCLTAHIDNFDPSTFLWLLEKMDVPYIPQEWDILRDRAYAKDPNKMNGMSVFGKYLSKMKLKQWKEYGWKDTERLRAENEAKKNAAAGQEILEREQYEKEMKEKLLKGEISEAQYMTLVSTITLKEENDNDPNSNNPYVGPNNFFDENEYISETDLPKPEESLTQEDKIYLAMKWGRTYKPSEWVELERIYNEMTASFDIQDADTINTLILLCKTTLKMNQSIDCGDIDGFQKLSKVSDSLRKSAKFTAAQNKEEKNDYVDSIGELVAMCEKEGFIPRFATDIPQDKVDKTLADMNGYLYKLVTQDLGFGQQIEDSLKKIQIQKEMNAAEEKAAAEDDFVENEDEDYEAFFEHQRLQKEADEKIYNENNDEGD